MLISFVIPAFNEEAYITNTLQQLHTALKSVEQTALSWEIIVCNNNSSDCTAQLAKDMGANVVFEPKNQISKARNTGAATAKGDWLIFLDADSYPNEGLLLEVVQIIKTDKHIGFGTTITVKDGSLFNKLRMERLNPFFRFFKFSGGVFLGCRKQDFETIEGFSDELYALEEFDFIFRLKQLGKKSRKGFTVLHKHPVITSGRKGELKGSDLIRLMFSNVAAIILFILYYFLPGKLFSMINSRFLGYWYKIRK
ncbi:MAG: glycosyltransferase [Bacteroidota bacterium]